MQVSLILLAFACYCAVTILLDFRAAALGGRSFFPLPLDWALVGVPMVMGFLFGRVAQTGVASEQMTLAEAWRELSDIAARELASGSPAHLEQVATLAREAETARRAVAIAVKTLWRNYQNLTRVVGGGAVAAEAIAPVLQFRELHAHIIEPGPLIVGRKYSLEFRIAPVVESSSKPVITPDFGPSSSARLSVHIISSDFEVDQRIHRMSLMPVGGTGTARTNIQPLHGGNCEVGFIVLVEPQLEILQDYRGVIWVQPT